MTRRAPAGHRAATGTPTATRRTGTGPRPSTAARRGAAAPGPAGVDVPVAHSPVVRWAVVAVLWLGLLVSVAPWWTQTEAGSIRDAGSALTAAGRITGLVAGYVLLVQVLLTSRLPVFERWIGTERVLRWHRDAGPTLLVAVLAHASSILVGYAFQEKVSLLDEATVLLRDYEDMVSAFAATGIVVVLGLTGIRAIRAVLPYEVWYYLHLTSYAVLLLGYGHQFLHGEQLFKPGPVRAWWIGLYLTVLAAVAWGRVLKPLLFNLRHRLRVADVVAESTDTISIYLTGRRLDRLDALGGHFFRWRFLAPGCWWQSHPFSLSAAGNGRWLRVTVKVVGEHTADLRELRPGTRVWAEGPSGSFTAAHRTRGRALLIAGGSGIAPVRALLEELPAGAAVVYRASTAQDVLLRQEMDWLAEARGVDLWYVIGSRADAGPRHVLSARGLTELVPDLPSRDVYVCGPPGLVSRSLWALHQAGVPRRQVHLASFEL
jgi:predicted ferric reductase